MMARRGSRRGGSDDGDDGDGQAAGEADEEEMAHADEGAAIACPYCGAANEIALDPSGGRRQDYVEDCQVCCQPWNVHVQYRRDGTADVNVTAADSD
ncbi:MAG: CPXCG motif-containing cysteine-rich protein [Gemmatimonadales bacterium]|jgi:transposase-like protein